MYFKGNTRHVAVFRFHINNTVTLSKRNTTSPESCQDGPAHCCQAMESHPALSSHPQELFVLWLQAHLF